MDGCSRCSSVENIVDDFRNEWLLYGFEHVILHTSLSSYHRLTVLRCPIVPLPRSDLYSVRDDVLFSRLVEDVEVVFGQLR